MTKTLTDCLRRPVLFVSRNMLVAVALLLFRANEPVWDCSEPALSKNGEWMTFAAENSSKGESAIGVMNLKRSSWRSVPGTSWKDRFPRVTSDGKTVFVENSERPGIDGIDLQTGRRTIVVNGWTSGFTIAGEKTIVFARSTGPHNSELFCSSFTGTRVKRLTYASRYVTFPQVRPDQGAVLVFLGRDRSAPIAVVDLHTGSLRRLPLETHGTAAWLSNGEVVYSNKLAGDGLFRARTRSKPSPFAQLPSLRLYGPTVDARRRQLVCTADSGGETKLVWLDFNGSKINRPVPTEGNRTP